MYYVSRAGGVLAAAALLVAAWFSIHLARADFEFRLRAPDGVARALALEPGNTEYLAFRALQVEYDGGDARPLLARAAELNPLSSAPRIRLGLDAEQRGDFSTAEKWLLEAARIDRQFEPRWTLANFYFRRENRGEFWKWMRAALEISYGDRRPAFDLCWQVSSDADEILSRVIPSRREVLAAYLGWLLETHRPQAAAPVALKLAAAGNAADRPLLLASDDALLEADDVASSLALWKLLGLAAPDGVYRGNFEAPAVGAGFDWRWQEIPGVVHREIDQPRTMHRISLSGRQPESCELLRQMVAVKTGARYRLSWDAGTARMESPTGIEWRIADQRAAVGNGHAEVDFTAPSDLVILKLVYQRPSGQVRAEGDVELWGIAVNPRGE